MKQTLEMKNKEKSNQIQCLDQNKTKNLLDHAESI